MIHFISNQLNNYKEFNTNTTIEDAVKYLNSKKILAVDTETEGFFNNHNKVIMLQIGDKDHQFVFDTRGMGIEPLREVLENDFIQKVFWNAKFDYKFIKHSFNIEVKNIYDAFLAECIVTNGTPPHLRKLSLAGVAERELGVVMDKEERNKFVALNGKPFTARQIQYGAKDVEYLLDLKDIVNKKINDNDLNATLDLENQFVSVLGDIEMKGIHLDVEKWLAVEQVNKEDFEEAELKLNEYIFKNLPQFIDRQLDLFSSEQKCSVDWSSPAQVIKVAQALGIDTKIEDKGKIKDSVGEDHLNKYKNSYEWVNLYLDYKHLQKAVSAYGKDFIKYVNKYTGRVHTNYWQILNIWDIYK